MTEPVEVPAPSQPMEQPATGPGREGVVVGVPAPATPPPPPEVDPGEDEL